jgi:ubiquitin C-terminal hydrolase
MLHSLPSCLILQLQCFSCEKGSFRKVLQPVSFYRQLSLWPYTLEGLASGQQVANSLSGNAAIMYELYSLYAFIVHIGSEANVGHCFAYAMGVDNCWHKFDDECVSEVFIDNVIISLSVQSNICVICYQQIG